MKQSPDVNWLPTVKTEELWIPKKEERWKQGKETIVY